MDSAEDMLAMYGPNAGPLDGIAWETRRDRLLNMQTQLENEIATDILQNMARAKNTYASAFVQLRKDMDKVRRMVER